MLVVNYFSMKNVTILKVGMQTVHDDTLAPNPLTTYFVSVTL